MSLELSYPPVEWTASQQPASLELQDIEDTNGEVLYIYILLLELELLVIIRIRLDIHFYYKTNPMLCIVVVYCFAE